MAETSAPAATAAPTATSPAPASPVAAAPNSSSPVAAAAAPAAPAVAHPVETGVLDADDGYDAADGESAYGDVSPVPGGQSEFVQF